MTRRLFARSVLGLFFSVIGCGYLNQAKKKITCKTCNGSGLCSWCGGSGKGKLWGECGTCGGNGRCKGCSGMGYTF